MVLECASERCNLALEGCLLLLLGCLLQLLHALHLFNPMLPSAAFDPESRSLPLLPPARHYRLTDPDLCAIETPGLPSLRLPALAYGYVAVPAACLANHVGQWSL